MSQHEDFINSDFMKNELKKTLQEIGPITPWWLEEEGLFCFEHPAYPAVDYLDVSEELTIKGYKRVLKEWLNQRAKGNIPDFVEHMTSGRGGKRAGAGRPVGSIKGPRTVQKRVPPHVAQWLENPANQKKLSEMAARDLNLEIS